MCMLYGERVNVNPPMLGAVGIKVNAQVYHVHGEDNDGGPNTNDQDNAKDEDDNSKEEIPQPTWTTHQLLSNMNNTPIVESVDNTQCMPINIDNTQNNTEFDNVGFLDI